ncbi:2'-5' RNA ligase family protein [Hydrocarboniphaga sp.]|uniref:2'-5' RNA ligase family protein n=1 Tax=Hydrocarboniphaga sp. TaxID=2033016 RepID=UPI003D098A2D
MEGPRLLLAAIPDAVTLQGLSASFASTGLAAQAGGDLSPSRNWHQSLSDRYNDTPENRRLLMEAGALVKAAPFVLGFNRFECKGKPGKFHWSLRPSKTPPAFDALLNAIKAALAARRIDEDHGHSAHVSVSYWAKAKPDNRPIPAVLWRISEFMLLRGDGHGDAYQYQELARWPLTAQPEGQLDFFGGL